MAEQVIGPYSKPYHKPCLTCIVCNKRLDSTLLVEHEGEPFCKNCHKTHLGQGKGGFALSVPLRPEKPAALRGQANSSASKSADDEYNEKLSGISVTPKKKSHTSNETHEEPPTPLRTPTMRANLSRPTTVAQSIDDLVASGVEVPIPHNRNSLAANSINKEVYGSTARTSTNPSHEQDQEILFANEEPLTRHFTSSREAESIEKSSQKSYYTPDSTDEYPQPSTPPSREAFASFRQDAGGLPSPQRKDPIALTREREKGLAQLGGAGAAKTYSPRTAPMSPNQSANTDKSNEYGYAPNSALTKMGLGSTVNAAAVGTPLCARCERPVCAYQITSPLCS